MAIYFVPLPCETRHLLYAELYSSPEGVTLAAYPHFGYLRIRIGNEQFLAA